MWIQRFKYSKLGWVNTSTSDFVAVTDDDIGYLPTINVPDTDLTTYFGNLNQSEFIREEMQLQKIVVLMNHVLFEKATEIACNLKAYYTSVILRLGTSARQN